jgi:heat shock protein HslJ
MSDSEIMADETTDTTPETKTEKSTMGKILTVGGLVLVALIAGYFLFKPKEAEPTNQTEPVAVDETNETAADESTETMNEAEPTPLTGTNWNLVTYADTDGKNINVAEGVTATSQFLPDGTISGNGGCNQYFGPYTADETNISVGTLGSTSMFCENTADLEGAFMTQLAAAKTYEMTDTTLKMSDANGAIVLQYEKAQ